MCQPAAGVSKAQAGPHLLATASDYATTAKVHLCATPGAVGRNLFVVSVDDCATGKPSATVQGVQLQFSLPYDPSMAGSTLTLSRKPDGTWQGSGLQLSMGGLWPIDVMVQDAANALTVPIVVTVAAPT